MEAFQIRHVLSKLETMYGNINFFIIIVRLDLEDLNQTVKGDLEIRVDKVSVNMMFSRNLVGRFL